MANSLDVPPKIKHRTVIWFSNSAPRYIPKIIENKYKIYIYMYMCTIYMYIYERENIFTHS